VVTPLVLRPALRVRVIYFALASALLALGVAITFSSVFGLILAVIMAFAVLNAAIRLWHPRSYATEVGERGFKAYDYRGRLVHDVGWTEITRLTFFNGNGLGWGLNGAGRELFLAWRCEPRRPGSGRQPWSGGGRNRAGEEFDGSLPDAYLGLDRMLELFSRRIAAERGTVSTVAPAPADVPLESW
jgi:hypothetical protein